MRKVWQKFLFTRLGGLYVVGCLFGNDSHYSSGLTARLKEAFTDNKLDYLNDERITNCDSKSPRHYGALVVIIWSHIDRPSADCQPCVWLSTRDIVETSFPSSRRCLLAGCAGLSRSPTDKLAISLSTTNTDFTLHSVVKKVCLVSAHQSLWHNENCYILCQTQQFIDKSHRFIVRNGVLVFRISHTLTCMVVVKIV